MVKLEKSLRWKALLFVSIIAVVSITYALTPQIHQPFHGVGVLKSADPIAAVGDNVTYNIKVFNPSDFDLLMINVTDDLLNFNVTIPFMASGNTTGVTYLLHRTIVETDVSPIVNTVRVEAVDSDGIRSDASTQAKTTIVERLLQIVKNGPEFAHEGDLIRYSITIKNLANSTLFNVTLTDELLGFGWQGDLTEGESNMFNVTYLVPKCTDEPITNKVVAWAKLNETLVYAEATWTVDILHPKLEVDKTVEPTRVHAGENVTYTIKVTNVGDADLFNLTLIDSEYGEAPKDLIPQKLMPKEYFAWQFNATIDKCLLDVAKATGADALGKTVSAWDRALVRVRPEFQPKSIGYWKNHPEAWPVNEVRIGNVTYTEGDALAIMEGANAKDATRMLTAQLIAAKLNRLSGAHSCFGFSNEKMNIEQVIDNADAFLINHPLGSNPQGTEREYALKLKSMLEVYNSNFECGDD